MQLVLHHYGFLTVDTAAWLQENEMLHGKPFRVYDSIEIASQQVTITFVEQTEGAVLTELVEPGRGNRILHKWLSKNITIYHTGYRCGVHEFDEVKRHYEEKGCHSLPEFYSEAFGGKRCVFIVTRSLGLIEIIEA